MKVDVYISRTYLLAIAAIISISSCTTTKKVPFETSQVVPSAEGTVKAKKDKNNNYALDISVIQLPDPQKLTPPRKAYVVWIETDKGIKNAGQVTSKSPMFSKTRKAYLSTVSILKPTRVFITAEDDPKIDYPGTQTVLSTTTF